MVKLQDEFESNKRIFFATVQRLRSTGRAHGKVSGIPALRVPSCLVVPNPGSTTSDPAHIQQILFEFHSQLAFPSDAF
jgi:hypothetical protein